MKVVICALIALAAMPAAAQTVYKCTEAGGTVFQSSPCTAGVQAERTYGGDYAVTPQRQAQIQREQAHARAVTQRSAAPSVQASIPRRSERESRHSRCEAAKSRRDAAYRRMGNNRKAADIRYWAGVVYDACK